MQFVVTGSLENELQLHMDRTPKSNGSTHRHHLLVILEIWS